MNIVIERADIRQIRTERIKKHAQIIKNNIKGKFNCGCDCGCDSDCC